MSVLAATAALAVQPQGPARSITIYSSAQPGAVDPAMYRPTRGGRGGWGGTVPGYAVVREDRAIDLGGAQGGRMEVRVTDVAALIDPTTVSFTSLTDPQGTRVIDQNFQFDLVSNDALLEKFIDQEITVLASTGQSVSPITGTLLSSQGALVLRGRDGTLNVINSYTGMELPRLPAGLITRPTLVWNVATDRPGPQTARISYQTEGVTWWADYNLVFTPGANANKGTLDVGAWVSILNQSGAGYDQAQLKLVAGQVQRAPRPGVFAGQEMVARSMAADMAPSFEQKSFFEYHLYTLSEPTTIPDNSTKQLELFPTAKGVPCDKVLVYAGQELGGWWGAEPMMDSGFGVQSKKDVDVYVRFDNKSQHRLGIPLPAGRIRVSQLDPADGGMEFIGEDVLRHTPRDETVLIRLGQAFDVVGERRQVDFKLEQGRNRMEETIEVQIRNRKQEPAEVIVQERMYRWTNWQFVGEPPSHKKLDASTVQFPVRVEAGGTQTVRYTVRYTW